MELGYKLPVGYWVQVDGYGKPYNISSDQQLMCFAGKIPNSRVVNLYLEPIIQLQEVLLEEVSLEVVKGSELVPYQEHGPYDVHQQGPDTVDGGNWTEKHGPATVDGPPDVKLHGSPASSDNVVGKVHARVSKEAGKKDKGKRVLEEAGDQEAEGEGEGEYEAEGGDKDDADFVIYSDYEQEADDIVAETCVDPTKIWDSLNVPNRPHEELEASGSEFEDVSDELCSLEGSDGEEGSDVRVQKFMHRTYHEFHPERDMHDPNFKVGMLFGTVDIFRKAIRAHAVKHIHDVKFQKNDKHRVRAVCKSEACNWFVYASWLSDHKTFQIKTLCNEHTCAMSFKNKFVNSRLIAEKYVDQWRVNPDWSFAGMSAQLRIDTNMDASKWQFYRAKHAAKGMIDGAVKE
ncbi:hypothetical protein Ddye_020167 [Dipteronia dyeriana]|uniref:Transposase MuDR plant domain-containing protein n=1 Tax=Dipteronia dyeriana TaxID=168575 RepID=A0AAD9WWE4_9ROSI|nr:hypothetical protein Ddye_020167 [Dipteronia dyeriana]